jgi:phosphate starvation-inducible PhoH-like protein
LVPIYQTIEKIVGDNKKSKLELHAATELAPLAFCRGRTFDHCVAILDEAQNVTSSQLKMWLTRIGTGGKLFICGDPEQNDLGQSPLAHWVQGLEHIDRVGVVRFDEADIVRDEDGLIREILQASRNL